MLAFAHVRTVSSHRLDLGVLGDKVRAGQNAATVLSSELPVFKATPGERDAVYV